MTTTPESPDAPQPAPCRHARRGIAVAIVVVLALIGAIIARPAIHLATVALRDNPAIIRPLASSSRATSVNDASDLNETPVAHYLARDNAPVTALADWAAAALTKARDANLPVAIGGARHTMGGHTMAAHGVFLDMSGWNHLELDAERDLLTVQSGATWAQIIPYLDARGKSIGVMQSNNSFSVGGSISANCHGWQYGQPPIASTVESFRLMLADGSIKTCSRNDNAELFSLVLGGYGLFGIILDVELRVVDNKRYRRTIYRLPGDAAWDDYLDCIGDADTAEMVFGRMDVSPDNLLQDLQLSVHRHEATGPIPPLKPRGMRGPRRLVFRGSEGSPYGKKLRWRAETTLQPRIAAATTSRNSLLHEPTTVFENRSSTTTDVLHEYFVPPSQLSAFVQRLQSIFAEHQPDLLNVTIRMVKEDPDTFLRYADQDMVAFVMLFAQKRTPQAERQMTDLSRQLIDAAIALGGRHYLPYRLHATPAQLHQAYPQAKTFFEHKRHYDPDERFQNQFYQTYGGEVIGDR